MSKPTLGRLQQVDLRTYWASESQDFTPWLAHPENVVLLGEALGMDLEVEGVEKDVGSFRADILCRDINSELGVLVENQLESTDHRHLGQIITYAAGLEVHTIVWVAKSFKEEHREAMEWLNSVSKDDFRFFGLEVELWKIGDSPPAPKFNIVVKPNNWTKTVRAKVVDDVSDADRKKLEFWKAFCASALAARTSLKLPQPQPKHWLVLRLGKAGIHLSAVASTFNTEKQSYEIGEVRAQVVIQNRDAKDTYQRLYDQRKQIEKEFGEKLSWNEYENVNRRTISVSVPADIENEADWPELHDWLRVRLERLMKIFRPRLQSLDESEA